VLIIPTLLGASLVMFVLTMLIPGDPALMRWGTRPLRSNSESARGDGTHQAAYERYVLTLGPPAGDMGALMAHWQIWCWTDLWRACR